MLLTPTMPHHSFLILIPHKQQNLLRRLRPRKRCIRQNTRLLIPHKRHKPLQNLQNLLPIFAYEFRLTDQISTPERRSIFTSIPNNKARSEIPCYKFLILTIELFRFGSVVVALEEFFVVDLLLESGFVGVDFEAGEDEF